MKKVVSITGNDDNLPKEEKAVITPNEHGFPYEAKIFSPHCDDFVTIIAAAEKTVHFAGAVAPDASFAFAGITIKSNTIYGVDALKLTLRMTSGIPVATVAIDGASNAALLSI